MIPKKVRQKQRKQHIDTPIISWPQEKKISFFLSLGGKTPYFNFSILLKILVDKP
ncbi:MAG: hypothetical protein JSW00_14265 [Thermoplasmata archaeon]|nr:MAG: hypothetical protein JSW00_14265 [Thermoplasmata archaeon]